MLSKFRDAVLSLNPQNPLDGRSVAALTIHHSDPLRIIYAPFEHMPSTAKLAIVGITPGKFQAETALRTLHSALKAGSSDENALRLAKSSASFAGPARKNLVKMLDHVGIHSWLGLGTTSSLFDGSELAHLTSALRYPVFKRGENYSGTPDMLKVPELRQMITTHLAEEVRALGDAVWMPLGDRPLGALRYLVSNGILREDRLLVGLPHPSGANNGPIGRFMNAPADDIYGRARERLRQQIAAISR